jgi:small subunit ribosomal protein S2
MIVQPIANNEDCMPRTSIQQLLLAGTHFGHLTRRWNPKMSKYIFDAKHGIHIIDLKKTQSCIDNACDAMADVVKRGEKVLLVGTKKQAKDIIRAEASRIQMPYVCERWLGGMLTNFSTIRKSLKRLQSLERMAADGTYEKISKKERLSIEKEKAKLDRALGGVRDMKKLPGAVFIADIKKEHIAVAEARKLSIPIAAIVDTNTDPDVINYPIPGNDDAFKSIGLITRAITEAIEEAAAVAAERGVVEAEEVPEGEAAKERAKPPRRRRPRRRPKQDARGPRHETTQEQPGGESKAADTKTEAAAPIKESPAENKEPKKDVAEATTQEKETESTKENSE